jgi:hypothetical protein
VQLIVRLNDNGKFDGNGDPVYPVQDECDCSDSIRTRLSPVLHLMMKKDASLNGVQYNGTYPNPVAVLHSENITYEITAVNANLQAGQIIIADTLPPYLDLVAGSYSDASTGSTLETPVRGMISWTKHAGPYDTVKVTYGATPQEGASASQSLFINRARVRVSDTVYIYTNNTYHQGAGISVVIFSASAGGQLYGAEAQALDFRTSPRTGVLVVPDEGYGFAGWSYDDYVSLRGDTVRAASGILRYEDIVVYGDVELHAVFVPLDDRPAVDRILEGKVVDSSNKVWANGSDLYIRAQKGAVVRIYSTGAVLRQAFTIDSDGLTDVRLERGIYIVTLDGGTGYKVRVE